MKTRINAALALLAACAVGTLYGPLPAPAGAQSAQRTRAGAEAAQAAAAQDPDMQAIQNGILTVAGRHFPKVLMPNAKSNGQSCCTVGDTRNQEVIKFYHEEAGVSPQGKVTYEGTTPYSPPSTCWVISSYGLTDVSIRGASRHLSAVPGGYSFVTSNQYQQVYDSMKDFVMNLNILDKYKIELLAHLQEFTNNYAAYSQSLSASHGSVLLYVKMESQGKYNGRSWYEGIVNTTETCCPPEIKDPLALKTALTTWVNNTVNSFPNKGKGGRTFTGVKAETFHTVTREGILATPDPSPTPAPPARDTRPRP
jgi:hypothetical protein